jgi:DNA-binding MarR family transcriptional regulator
MQNIRHGGKSDARIEADTRRFRELVIGLSRQSSLRDPIAAMCEEAQLTPPQIHAVVWLGQDGPLTMGKLACRLGVTEKTITGLVDRLEAGGYLERERDQEDRRVVRARLTKEGAAVYAEIDGHLHDKVAAFLKLLDPTDRKALFRILEKLLHRPAPAVAAPETRKP